MFGHFRGTHDDMVGQDNWGGWSLYCSNSKLMGGRHLFQSNVLVLSVWRRYLSILHVREASSGSSVSAFHVVYCVLGGRAYVSTPSRATNVLYSWRKSLCTSPGQDVVYLFLLLKASKFRTPWW